MFARCNQTIKDPEEYLHKWFLDSRLEEIKRENLKEFFLWAFFNRDGPPGDDDGELEEYVAATEKLLGRRFADGRGKAVCLRLTIDEVKMLRRSILWYCCVGFVDVLASLRLRYYGLHLHRTPLSGFFGLFPWRPPALLTSKKSSTKYLSYWHRPHTSSRKLPVVFIHGIGIGLYPYVDFLAELNSQHGPDDQVGIIAVELMPVSFRLTHSVPSKDIICAEIHDILKAHGWSDFVLVSHSYGSTISTHLLKYKPIASQIAAMVLIDPITILLHQPEVAYNFTYRKPKTANEHQLYYFASMDMGVSHALSRGFFWSENIVWREELEELPTTISLAEKDLIVNTRAVRDYLEVSDCSMSQGEKTTTRSSNIEVIWNEDIDHAQVFDRERRRRRVLESIRGHCSQRGRRSSKA